MMNTRTTQLTAPFVSLAILLTLAACGIMSDIYYFRIQNHTTQPLAIYVKYSGISDNGSNVFDLNPGEEKTAQLLQIYSWEISARDRSGNTVFSRTVTAHEVREAGMNDGKHYVYLITIESINTTKTIDNGTTPK